MRSKLQYPAEFLKMKINRDEASNVIRQECGQTLGRVRVRTDIGQ